MVRPYLLAVAALMAAAAPCTGQTKAQPRRVLTAADWRADVAVLAREMPRFVWGGMDDRGHVVFDSIHRSLDGRLASLSDDAVVLSLAAMVAAAGDEQTALQLPPTWRRFAINTRWFACTPLSPPPCELRVIAAAPGMERYLGMQVLAINDVPVAEVHRRFTPLIPGGISPAAVWTHSTNLMQMPNALHGVEVTARIDTALFTLRDSAGAKITAAIPATAPMQASRPWRRAQLRVPFARGRPADAVWWAVLPDGHNVYVGLRSFPDSAEVEHVADSVIPFAERHQAPRIVFDLRTNGGGDFGAVVRRLLPALTRHATYGAPGRVYALTGPGTLGNGAALALALHEQAGAVLVGLNTGTRPSIAVDRSRITLPKSGLVVVMTRESGVGSAADTSLLAPDHRAETTWTTFHQGRDVALEWVLAQPVPAQRPGRRGPR